MPVLSLAAEENSATTEEVVALPSADEENVSGEEETSSVNLVGFLVEIGSTDLPTTIVIRDDQGTDYTVDIPENVVIGQRWDQVSKLEDWLPGDRIRVIGTKNENTGVITASVLVNHSIFRNRHFGLNGWIEEIDKENSQIKVQWRNRHFWVRITDKTHLVVGLKNPASIDDLKIGDRVRGRLLGRVYEEGSSVPAPEAKIIIVLRRGKVLFMKSREFITPARLIELSSVEVPTDIKVKILPNRRLRKGDVNNLLGLPGEIKTVHVTENTRLVRRFFGKSSLREFLVGDKLWIVGRANDDGTITAKIIRDSSIWIASSRGVRGTIIALDKARNRMVIRWRGKKYRVDVNDNTRIVKNGKFVTINELSVGDKIRGRGLKHKHLPIVVAREIVVVKNMPELKAVKPIPIVEELSAQE